MRVRADDGRDAAVEMPAHRDFLRRRFGVEVDEDDLRFLSRTGSISVKRRRETDRRARVMNTRPITLMTATATPLRRLAR